MKKLLILAAGVATLGLGACNRQSCPAYGHQALNYKSTPVKADAPVMASTAKPVARF